MSTDTGGRPAVRHSRRTWSPGRQLGVDVVIGVAARLVLVGTTEYRGLDAGIFAGWARTMHDHGVGQFYAKAPLADHLPGDLWLIDGLQVIFTALGGHDFTSPAFELATNAVPVVADVLVGVLLFRIVCLWASRETAARTARWYLLNPAVILLAGAWGQWDSLSMAVLLAGCLLVLRAGSWWVGGVPLLTWAVLIKPQLVVAAALVMLWWLLGPRSTSQPATAAERGRSAVRVGAEAAACLGLSVLTALVVLAPFRVGLAWTPDGGSSLWSRVRYAADLHPFTTMGAANVWLVLDRRVIGPLDDVDRWGGLSAAAAGFASCLAPTRVHERYYFPVLVLLLVWSAVRGLDVRSARYFWCFSAVFVVDLVLPFSGASAANRWLHRPEVLATIGLVHVVLFVVLLVVPWQRRRRSDVRVDGSWGATAAHRTAPG